MERRGNWVDDNSWLQEFAQHVKAHRDKLTAISPKLSKEHDEAAARTLLFFAEAGRESHRPKWRGFYRNFFRDEQRQRLK